MVKWTEVSAYSGLPVEEDAPTNATGAAVAGTGDDSSVVVMKKKKKTFLDARTKAYKAHQKRLEAARQRREERKKNASKINEGQLDEIKKASVQFSLGMNSDMMKAKKDLEKKGHKVKVSGNKMTVTAKPGSDIDRELSDIRNFYDRGVKIKAEQLDEVNVTFIKKFAADMKKDKQFKPYADKFMKLAMKGGSPRDALEKSVPDFIAGKDIEKLISKNRMSNIFGEEKPKTFTQKVQEQIGGFGREAFLAENNMDVIKSIVKSKGAKDIKMKDGKLKMDAFTASAIAQVYDKVNPTNKKKMEDLANGRKADLMKLQALAMKFVK